MSLATILIDPGYTLLIGILFGIAALRNRTRALGAGLVACAIFGVGIPVLCYVLYPGWMWMYTVDPTKVPAWFVVYIFALYFIPFLAGFAFVPKRGGWVLFAVCALLEGALMAALWDRYVAVGTFEEFHRGAAVALPKSRLGTILNILTPVMIAGIVGLWLWARRTPAKPARHPESACEEVLTARQ